MFLNLVKQWPEVKLDGPEAACFARPLINWPVWSIDTCFLILIVEKWYSACRVLILFMFSFVSRVTGAWIIFFSRSLGLVERGLSLGYCFWTSVIGAETWEAGNFSRRSIYMFMKVDYQECEHCVSYIWVLWILRGC